MDRDVRIVHPCEYPGWDELLQARGGASVFHSSGWARVLKETYGHRPFYFCEIEEGRLKRLLPVMEVCSRWTGKRGVSLPFTDTVVALVRGDLDASAAVRSAGPIQPGQSEVVREFCEAALKLGQERGWRYLECRGGCREWAGSSSSVSFYGHTVDLSAGPEALFKALEGAVRRGIRKAEQSRVQVEFESSVEGIRIFYELHCGTRQRHGVPPQPFKFFENIARYLLQAGHGFVAIARHEGRPIAASVFFHFGRGAVYKFGASDYRFQQLRPNNLVMWEGMKHLAEQGLASLDMGRTSLSNEGLRRFKLGFGAREGEIHYSRYDLREHEFVKDADRAESWSWMNGMFGILPGPLFRLTGRLVYPHLS